MKTCFYVFKLIGLDSKETNILRNSPKSRSTKLPLLLQLTFSENCCLSTLYSNTDFSFFTRKTVVLTKSHNDRIKLVNRIQCFLKSYGLVESQMPSRIKILV